MSFTIISDYNLWTQNMWYVFFSDEAAVSMTARHGQHNGRNDLLIYTHIDRDADTNVVSVPFLRNAHTIALIYPAFIAFFSHNCSQFFFFFFFFSPSLMIHLLIQTACLSLHFPTFISILWKFFGQQTLLEWLSSYSNTFARQSSLYFIDRLDNITMISFLRAILPLLEKKIIVLIVWTQRYRTFKWALVVDNFEAFK